MARLLYDTKEIPSEKINWILGKWKVDDKEDVYSDIYLSVSKLGVVGIVTIYKYNWINLSKEDIIILIDNIHNIKLNNEYAEKSKSLLEENYYLSVVYTDNIDWSLANLLYEIISVSEFRNNCISGSISLDKYAVEYINNIFHMDISRFYYKLLELNVCLYERLKKELKKRNIEYTVKKCKESINVPYLKEI